jgi:hypothetical protein
LCSDGIHPPVARWGYHGYFLAGIGLSLAAGTLSILFTGKR